MRSEESGQTPHPHGSRVESYTDLLVWKKSMDLADAIYDMTVHFPKTELYGLSSQLRRAAVSIPSNIAEGWGRGQTGEYLQFLRYSRGSLYEVETQLRIAARRGYAETARVDDLLKATDEVSRMLAGLANALRR